MAALTPERMKADLAEMQQSLADSRLWMRRHAELFEQRRHFAARPPRRWMRFTAATEAPVNGVILDMNGCDLRRFHANPVVLWCHEVKQLPIGTARVFIDDRDRLIADIRWADSRRGREVRRAYRKALLSAVSIGYDPLDYYTRDDAFVISRWTLTEVSATPLPADREAVRDALERHVT